MDRTIILSAAILVGWAVNSNASDEAMNYTDFSEVKASNGVEVDIEVGEDFAVIAYAPPDRDLDRLVIRKHGDVLDISQKGRRGFAWGLADLAFSKANPVSVTVKMPSLDAVSASAGADVAARGRLTAALDARASSGSDLHLSGNLGDSVTLSATSGAQLSIGGACEAATLSASSGAELDADDLVCGSVIARASSGASISTWADHRIIASASSGGDIRVSGNPEAREITRSVGGDVRLVQ